ncbi:GNAT family N-acetyltransferase [Rhodocista pekingensis]|uniref:GNAT family N-acetyltransferase n=1 Tax=Rhodocista pekingensis TaxID=201185 RepID=A0ABW2KP42_9PROT
MRLAEEVRGAEALAALAPAWERLWRDDPAATPFHHPAWLVPWARIFQPDRCRTLTLRDGGRLLALWPLFLLGDRLLPLGCGTTDWLGPVAAPGLTGADLAPLFALLERDPDWCSCEADRLPPGSPLAGAAAPWPGEDGEGEPAPALALPAPLSRGRRQNLRTGWNRLRRLGLPIVRQVRGGEVAATFDALASLHAARWRERGEAGVLADPEVAAFHRLALPALEAAGLLRLLSLDLDGRPVAVLYGLQAKGCFHYYLGGFDPALAEAGPGTLLVGEAIGAATAEGCTLFDFLRGREPYKYGWGAVDRPCRTRRFVRDGYRGDRP